MHDEPMPDPGAFALACTVSGPDGTGRLGRAAAGVLAGGEIVLLSGPLGAGKTAFVQAVCAGLGVTDEVVSPTFTLANRYEGRLVVHHLDFYRIGPDDDLADVGLEAVLDEVESGEAVLLAEWPTLLRPFVPRRLEILVLPDGTETGRRWLLDGVPELPDAWRRVWNEAV